MENIDTGRVRVSIQGDKYLLISIYTDEEVTSEDVFHAREFMGQFDRPVPALLFRQGNYSLSFEAQYALMNEAASKLKAAAYVDRSLKDQALTDMAKSTYMKNVPVKSFFTIEESENWLQQFGGILA